MIRHIMRCALLVGLMMLPAWADEAMVRVRQDCTILWDPLSDSDMQEYRVYTSRTPGKYDPEAYFPVLHPAHDITCLDVGLTPDGTYYVTVVAADTAGNTSGPSNEVGVTFDDTAPGRVIIQIIERSDQTLTIQDLRRR